MPDRDFEQRSMEPEQHVLIVDDNPDFVHILTEIVGQELPNVRVTGAHCCGDALKVFTYATVDWVDVFTREMYSDIVVESLRYCQREKGLVLHAWCIMTNHVHLIASASQGFEC